MRQDVEVWYNRVNADSNDTFSGKGVETLNYQNSKYSVYHNGQ